MSKRQAGATTFGATFWLAAIAAAALGLGGAWWLAQPDTSVSQYERLAMEIGCQCGTCPNRPILTCGCGFADNMLGELRAVTGQGQSDDQVMATFVSSYNPSVRIKPAGRGLDLTAWAAPLILLTVGAVALGAAVASWTRRDGAGGDDGISSRQDGADIGGDERDRLRRQVERELGELGD